MKNSYIYKKLADLVECNITLSKMSSPKQSYWVRGPALELLCTLIAYVILWQKKLRPCP